MNLLYSTVVIFGLGAIFAQSAIAAPTIMLDATDDQTLSNALSGLIQNNDVPDPGIADFFNNMFNIVASKISENLDLADRDPNKIKQLRQYIENYTPLLETVADFVEQYYSNETVAINLIRACRTFFSTLEKMIDGNNAGQQTYNRDVLIMAKLIRKLAAA